MFRPLPWAMLGAAALGTLGSGLGIWSSHIERMSHFRLWWIGLLLALVFFFLGKRRAIPALLSAFVAATAIIPIARYWKPAPGLPSAAGEPTCKVIAWNVLHDNPADRQAAARWLAAQDADVILLTECTLAWRDCLTVLDSFYPHRISSKRDGSEGMLLLSKHPLDPPDPAGLRQGKPWISTVAHLPSANVRLIGMHPRTPRSGHRFDERNIQYDQAASIARDSQIPVILMGDLNCTPFSPWFRRLLDRGSLQDSAVGYGFRSTWSGQGIGLPIDHILISSGWQVVERRVYQDRMGSDHRPVIASLQVRAGP
jgi:endonuclease/exonuclease/phosphatase (EEP) superfamily protein YafD